MNEVSPILKPDARRRLPAGRLAALAVLSWAAPAAAETAHTSLAVSATVVPACIVSTRPQSASADPIALTCSNTGQGSVSIARAGASGAEPPVPERQAAPATKAGDPSPQAEISYVTITY